MKLYQSALSIGLVAALALSSGCRRKKPADTMTPEPPAVEEVNPQAPSPSPSPSASEQGLPVAASVESFQTSTEFEDLTKDFQLYCEYKGRVPTDINEFFRDQKIRPPAVPPGTRLAIDPIGKRIILTK